MHKILIKAPSTKEEILSSYMMVHHLHSDLPEVQIHIVVDKSLERYYHYIPFDVCLHTVDESKMTLPQIHRFAYNLHDVFNVDYFFDLQETKESAFYGKAFKAKERYGFEGGFVRELFLNKVLEKNESQTIDYQYLNMLNASGLIASDLSTFEGDDNDHDTNESLKHVLMMFEEFGFAEGQILKLIKENFPESEIIVYSENEAVEFKGITPVHDVDKVLELLHTDCLGVCNTPYYYGILKYMKNKFLCFGSYKNYYPFFSGSSLDIEIKNNGRIENLSDHNEDLLDTDCIKELAQAYLELSS